jgi:hypothetical protein
MYINHVQIGMDIISRLKRGEGHMMTKTPQLGRPQKRGAGWFVPSGAVGYHVEHIDGRWRCTCPSFRWKKAGTCKHIAEVRKEVTYRG